MSLALPGPSSLAVVVSACVAAVGSVVTALLVWNRVRGSNAARVAQRIALLVLCQMTAAALVFAQVNHVNTFFVSWSELFGAASSAFGAASPQEAPASGNLAGARPLAGTSRAASLWRGYTIDNRGVAHIQVVGSTSKLTGDVYVWTPPGYDARHPGGYPVIMAINGYPGQPLDAFRFLDLPTSIPAAINSGVLPPSIVVSATTNFGGGNWGCANSIGGPGVATWLTQDVPAVVSRDFAVRTGARWAVVGLSEGAICAVRLALTAPNVFGTAVSLSGNNAPDAPNLSRTAVDAHANDLRTLAARGTSLAVELFLAGSLEDGTSVADARALRNAAGPGIRVEVAVLAHGGHNAGVWKQMLTPALSWLGHRWPSTAQAWATR